MCGQVICRKHRQDKLLFLVVIEHLQLYSTAHCFLTRHLFLDKKSRQYCYLADGLFRTELRKDGSTGFKTFVGYSKLPFWTQLCVTARHLITRLLFWWLYFTLQQLKTLTSVMRPPLCSDTGCRSKYFQTVYYIMSTRSWSRYKMHFFHHPSTRSSYSSAVSRDANLSQEL